MQHEPEKIPAFGQADSTDGRDLLDWKSKYTDALAHRAILIEAIYIGLMFLAVPIGMFILWLEYPKYWFHLSDQRYASLLKYGLAWLGGILGGTLFDMKWLYHSVARQLWHMDRRLWRIFTPHISGGLAFAVVALISSGIIRIFDSKATQSPSTVTGIAFMVGYFSDNAIAKLMEVANTLFGPSRTEEKHKEPKADRVKEMPSGTGARSAGE